MFFCFYNAGEVLACITVFALRDLFRGTAANNVSSFFSAFSPQIDYMIGYTNNDLYAPLMAFIGNRFAKANGAFVYYFDLDAPGDGSAAFHSCDLRYMFQTLSGSRRPYGARDYEAAEQLAGYLANFARGGDPNGEGLPAWRRASKSRARVLRFAPEGTAMGRADYVKMTRNLLIKGEPKA